MSITFNRKLMFQNYFKNWVVNHFFPCGILFTSENAKNILNKNNLFPSLFLRPFFDLKKIKIFDELRDFKLLIFDAENYKRRNENELNSCLINFLNKYQSNLVFNLNEKLIDKKNINNFLNKLKNYLSLDIFNEFENIILEYLYFDECELFQQPLINIYMCEINEAKKKIPLLKKQNFPYLFNKLYQKGFMDLIILLNDSKDNDKKENDDIRKRFLDKNNYESYSIIIDTFSKNDNNNNNYNHIIWNNYLYNFEKYLNYNDNNVIFGKFFDNSIIKESNQKVENFIINYFLRKYNLIINNYNEQYTKDNEIILSFLRKDPYKNLKNRQYLFDVKVLCLSIFQNNIFFLGLLYFYKGDYKNAYERLNNLQDKIKKDSKSKRYENSIRQIKYICSYLKSREKLDEDKIIRAFKKYKDNKEELMQIRSFFITLRMYEDYGNMEKLLKFCFNNTNLFNINYTNLNCFIYEKYCFYYLCFQKPYIRKFIFYLCNFLCYFNDKIIGLDNYLNILKYLYDLDEGAISNNFDEYHKYIYFKIGDMTYKLGYYDQGLIINSKNLLFYKNKYKKDNKNNKKLFSFINNNKDKDKDKEELDSLIERLKNCLKLLNINNIDNNIFNNFPIPKIDNFHIYIINQQDLEICNNICFYSEGNNNNIQFINYYNSFKKYLVNSDKLFINLTEKDINCLKILDAHIKKIYNISNYLINKENIANVNDVFYFVFQLENPLNYDLLISNLTLIYDNENLIECEKINIKLNPFQNVLINIKIKCLQKGKIEISGIKFEIFEKIKINHYFSYHNKNKLYNYIEKRYKKNKFITLSNNNNSDNFYIKILDYDSNFNIQILKNPICFNYELFLLPIKIINKSEFEPKKFTIFLETNDNNNLIYLKYITFDFNNTGNNTYYVPLIPQKQGIFYLKIVIKFEERNDIEIFRYLRTLSILPSLNININENLLYFDGNIKKKILNIFINKINSKIANNIFIDNDNEILFNQKNVINKENISLWNFQFNDENKLLKNYNIKESLNKKGKLNNFENILNLLNNNVNEQNKKNIIKLFKKNINNLNYNYLNFIIKENNKLKHCYYFFKLNDDILNLNDFYIDKNFCLDILKDSIKITRKNEDLDEKNIYSTFLFKVNFKNYSNFLSKIIEFIIINIDQNNNLEWIGLTSYKLENISNEEKIFEFNAIQEKNEQFSFLYFFNFTVEIKNSEKKLFYNKFNIEE